ncbi:hypothetical protein BJ912DRAFT_468564 [Pholiota molesta]|nr:hypothetical protein BJ912DRAFT_468564 [Pholiota molesta]
MALHINDVRSREGQPAQDTLVALKLLELEYVVRRNWSSSDAQISCRPLDNIARQYRARGMGNEAGHTMWRAVGSTYSRARSPTTTIPPPTPHLHPFPTAHARRYDSPPTACYLRHHDSIPPKSSSCPDPGPAIADDAPRSAKGDDGTSSRHSVRELLADDINRETPRHPSPSHFDVVPIVQTLRPPVIRFARPLQPTTPSATAHFHCCYTAVRPRLRHATDTATQATSDGMDRMGHTRREAAGSQHREACVYAFVWQGTNIVLQLTTPGRLPPTRCRAL